MSKRSHVAIGLGVAIFQAAFLSRHAEATCGNGIVIATGGPNQVSFVSGKAAQKMATVTLSNIESLDDSCNVRAKSFVPGLLLFDYWGTGTFRTSATISSVSSPGFTWNRDIWIDAPATLAPGDGIIRVYRQLVGENELVPNFTDPDFENTSQFQPILDIPVRVSTHVWSQGFQASSSALGLEVLFAYDAGNNLYVAGEFVGIITLGSFSFTSEAGSEDAFVMKLSPTGSVTWAKQISGTGSVDVTGLFVNNSVLYLSGSFGGQLKIDPATPLTASGSSDAFLAKLDPSNGGYQWQRQIGGTGNDAGGGVDIDTSGNPIIVGNFEGTVNFGGTNKTSEGLSDCYMARYSAANGLQNVVQIGGSGSCTAMDISVDTQNRRVVTGFFGGTVCWCQDPNQPFYTSWGAMSRALLNLGGGGLGISTRPSSSLQDRCS